MAMSVDGMVSGLNTTDMINQLMQAEAAPQTALKNKITAQNKAVTAYQGANTKLAALATAAKALGEADTWGTMKTTSSSDAAIVTAKAGTASGSLSFTVNEVAKTHTVTFKDDWVASPTDADEPVMSGNTIEVLLAGGGKTVVAPQDASLSSIVNIINSTPDAAYKATTVQIAPGRYTLQLTATAAGGANSFVAEGGGYFPAGIDLLGTPTVTTQGTDAKITVGDPGVGVEITSPTNTFTDVLPGLSVTVTKKSADLVTVGVAKDPAAVADKVGEFVDAANAALAEIRTSTATKSATGAAGPLAGDTALRQLSQSILGAIGGGAGALGSLSAVGIGLNRTGEITFDREKFLTSYKDDPAKTQAYFDGYTDKLHAKAKDGTFEPGWDQADGIARRLQAISVVATEGVLLPTDLPGTVKQGTLGGIIQRRNEAIKGLNDQVSEWDTRLELRKSNLQRQFSGLEVALSKMKEQSSWLAGQLAGLG